MLEVIIENGLQETVTPIGHGVEPFAVVTVLLCNSMYSMSLRMALTKIPDTVAPDD
jgi:hypothetical protein